MAGKELKAAYSSYYFGRCIRMLFLFVHQICVCISILLTFLVMID
jgi:hypothetical protein